MSSYYFESLRNKCCELDKDIEKLETTWKPPYVLVGSFATSTEETEVHVEGVRNAISNTQRGIEEVLSNIQNTKTDDGMSIKQFIQEIKQKYETLKDECNDLAEVFMEYGYTYHQDNKLKSTTDNQNENIDHSLVQEMENFKVECSPNLSWASKSKQSESVSTFNDSCLVHTFTTPITNNLSYITRDTPVKHRDYVCTPVRERPQEPIYSKHFYNIFKK